MPKKKTEWKPEAEAWLRTRFRAQPQQGHSHARGGIAKQLKRHLESKKLMPEHASACLLKDFITYRHRKWRQTEETGKGAGRRTRASLSQRPPMPPQ